MHINKKAPYWALLALFCFKPSSSEVHNLEQSSYQIFCWELQCWDKHTWSELLGYKERRDSRSDLHMLTIIHIYMYAYIILSLNYKFISYSKGEATDSPLLRQFAAQLKSSKGAELGATSSLSSASFILSVAKDQRRSASRSTSMTARLRLKS